MRLKKYNLLIFKPEECFMGELIPHFLIAVILTLTKLVLLFFVLKSLKANVHKSLWLIFFGLTLDIIFSFTARVYSYLAVQNVQNIPIIQRYMLLSTISNSIGIIGFIVAIVGFCVLLIYLTKQKEREYEI